MYWPAGAVLLLTAARHEATQDKDRAMTIDTQAIAPQALQPHGGAARIIRAASRALTGFLAFLGDAIVQLAVEDVCMAVVTATVSAVLGLHFAA